MSLAIFSSPLELKQQRLVASGTSIRRTLTVSVLLLQKAVIFPKSILSGNELKKNQVQNTINPP
jgi:hypothetical protein